MRILDKLYSIAPVWMQNLMCSVRGGVIAKQRYSKNFIEALIEFESGQLDEREQLKKILQMISFIPYYSSRNYISSEIGGEMNHWSQFPILTKAEVKKHLYEFINTQYTGKIFEMHTGGTTGSGLIFPYSVEMENRQWAIWWKYRRSLGITMDTWCGWFGGKSVVPISYRKPPYWRVNYFGKQIMFSASHLNAFTVGYYHKKICKSQLEWLHGYASVIANLATLIVQYKHKPIISVKYVTTGSENLLPTQIDIIKKAFPNALVRTHYGLSEGVANISQDIDGEWRVDTDFAHVEFIPIDEENPSRCRIIGTSFWNDAFPLVRYDTGDVALVEWVNGCAVVKSIEGRADETVLLPDGTRIGAASLSLIFKVVGTVKEAQIYQRSIDEVIIRLVVLPSYDKKCDEEKLLKEARVKLGDIKVLFEYRDYIERTKSGKYRLVISKIS